MIPTVVAEGEKKIRWYGSTIDVPLSECTHFLCTRCDEVKPISEYAGATGYGGFQYCKLHLKAPA